MKSTSAVMCRALRAGALAAVTLGSFAAHGASGVAPAIVAVKDAYYVVAGRAFDDLNVLEAAVRQGRPAAVVIVSCSAAAARGWMAAVHRFSDLPLQVQVGDAAAPACVQPAAMPVAQRFGGPSGIDDAQVRAYWLRVQP